MQIVIEAVKGYSDKVNSREFTNKEGKPTTMHSQDMYIHNGGPFPVKFSMSLSSPDDLLPVGKYTLTPEAFKVGQYDRLEINSFDLRNSLKPLKVS